MGHMTMRRNVRWRGRGPGALAGVAMVMVLAAGAKACPAPPPPVRDLAPPRFYGDAAGAKVDAELKRQHKAAVAPLTSFLRHVVKDTDNAVRRGDARAAQCPLAWIEVWARADAWLGAMGTKQAEYQRKWDLAGVALAYLKLKPYADARQRESIEPWLVRFADQARAFFDDPGHKRNNHWYWLGLGLGATALAAGSPRHWKAARNILGDGLRDIAADGSLPFEMAREGRALHYHAFGLTPLVALAELGSAKGEDWYGLDGGALHRLVALTARGLADPRVFDRLAGHVQERPPGTGAGWLQLYEARFPGRIDGARLTVPATHRWLGGDVGLLAQTVATMAKAKRPAGP